MKLKLLYSNLLIFLVLFYLGCGGEDDSFNNVTGPESPAEAQNLDGELLKQMLERIEDGTYGAINSLIIVRNGDIVVEEYFRGWARNDLHEIFSVTKSIASMLIGIAIDQGFIKGVDEKLLSFFPEYTSFANHDSLKDAITLEHVLTMTAGFEWDESTIGSSRGDWIKYVLDLPMSDAPGTRFYYNSGSTLLLAVIIQNKTGKSTNQFAEEFLFNPIGIVDWVWGVTPRVTLPDFYDTSGGLGMRPFDMVNLGVLMLNMGKRHDRQIISEEWVTASTKKQVSAGTNSDYGYKWWRFSDNSSVAGAAKVNDIYFAWGAGGQFIFAIPHLEMVVVSTAENFDTVGQQMFGILRDFILAAVIE